MKAINRIIGFIFIIMILAKPIAIAQEIENIPVGKYLVIGTFHIKDNALRFSEYAKNKDDFNTRVAYDPAKNYYRVYIKTYRANESGHDDVWMMRGMTEYTDTWVMIVEPYDKQTKSNLATNTEDPVREDTKNNWTQTTTTVPPTQEKTQPPNNPNEVQNYGNVIDVDGKVIGVVEPDGNIKGAEGEILGQVDAEGKVTDQSGKTIGEVGADGFVVGANGEILGTVGADGRVISNLRIKNEVVGFVSANGVVRDADGKLIGTVGAYGKVKNEDGEIIGAVGYYGQVIGNNGEVIGSVGKNNKAIAADGSILGDIGKDGKVRNANGQVIGAVGAFGQVIGLDGKVIGVIGADGKAIGSNGEVLGTVGDDLKVRNANGDVIGTVGSYGQVIGLDGKVIGTVGSDGKVINAEGVEIGKVGAYGIVVDFNNKIIGSVGKYGQVIGDNGEVIGTISSYGQAIDSDGQFIGTVGSGLTPQAVRAEFSNITIAKQDDPIAFKTVPKTYEEAGQYKMFFNTYYTKNGQEIKGNVDIIDPKSLKLLRTARSLELVKVADPNNGEHSIQLIANIFGYKKVQHDFVLTEPFDSVNAEFLKFDGDVLVATFPLRRYDQGDIATMYNVFFFGDAAIMRPNSQFELNTLLEMLNENEDLKIKIHGHTNSNERGKIISLPEGSTEFFNINQEVDEGFGSAKKLSLRRSEVIRNYLIAEGIDPDRMEVIGWGGKRPIYHKMDKLAVKNVRVEIEILEN